MMKRRSSLSLEQKVILVTKKSDIPKPFPKKQKQVTIHVTDNIKSSRISSIKAIQDVLLWTFAQQQTNPMWINIRHKSLVKHVFVMFVETQGDILQEMIQGGKMSSLELYQEEKYRTRHRYEEIFISEKQPWYNVFSTLPLPKIVKPKHTDKVYQSYSQSVYDLFKSYTLTDQELRSNLFPTEKHFHTSYINTSLFLPLQKKTLSKLILGMDCQMVTTQYGRQLAKVTIVDFSLSKIYQKLIKPKNKIINYHTQFSGITECLLRDVTTTLEDVQQDLKYIIYSNTILVGHSLENDLHSLEIIHNLIVDTAILFKDQKGNKVSLKNLSYEYLKTTIQQVTHDSYQDAVTSLSLAKLKIQILDKLSQDKQKQVKFDILTKLCKKQELYPVIFTNRAENCELLKNQDLEVIELENNSVTSWTNQVKWYLKRNHPSKILLQTVRRSETQSYQKYYEDLNLYIDKLKGLLPKNSVLVVNFQLETEHKNRNFRPNSIFIST